MLCTNSLFFIWSVVWKLIGRRAYSRTIILAIHFNWTSSMEIWHCFAATGLNLIQKEVSVVEWIKHTTKEVIVYVSRSTQKTKWWSICEHCRLYPINVPPFYMWQSNRQFISSSSVFFNGLGKLRRCWLFCFGPFDLISPKLFSVHLLLKFLSMNEPNEGTTCYFINVSCKLNYISRFYSVQSFRNHSQWQ